MSIDGAGASAPARKLPLLDSETAPFWTGGETGQLLVQCCASCGRFQHPPLSVCPGCGCEDLKFVPVSGRGRVKTFTINYQAWVPSLEVPFVFAAIELAEQAELYVMSNVLAPVDAVRIGMAVRVCFEQHENIWLPLFRPEGAGHVG